jgi:hypothetical protein
MKKLTIVAVASVFGVLAGCMSSPASFNASSKPYAQGKYTVLGDEVAGTNTQVNWLFFTFGAGGSGQRHALNDALEQVPGADGLISMAIDTENFVIFPFVLPSFYTTRVTGTPVKSNAND